MSDVRGILQQAPIVRVPACIAALCLYFIDTRHQRRDNNIVTEHLKIGCLCGAVTFMGHFRTQYPTVQAHFLIEPVSSCYLNLVAQFPFISLVYPLPWQISPVRAAQGGGAAERHLRCESVIWTRGLKFPLCPSHDSTHCWPRLLTVPHTRLKNQQPLSLSLCTYVISCSANEQVFNYAPDVFCLMFLLFHKSWASTHERIFHTLFPIINIIRAAS